MGFYGIYIYIYMYVIICDLLITYIYIYIYIYIIRVRVLGTDYGSSWVRELTWALLPGEELFAAAAADPHGNRAGVSKFEFRRR